MADVEYDKLFEIIKNNKQLVELIGGDRKIDWLADYLVQNNTTVLPCRLGSILYAVYWWDDNRPIVESEVVSIQQRKDGLWKFRAYCIEEGIHKGTQYDYSENDFGRHIFFSREAAEQFVNSDVL